MLVALLLAAAFAVASRGKIVQPEDYHCFADPRELVRRIPNSLNVLSNLAFLFVGLFAFPTALRLVRRARSLLDVLPELGFITGVTATALGSAYYHWAPDNDRLVLDRIPMTLAFTGLSAALFDTYFVPGWRRVLGVTLPLLGVLSVLYWHPGGGGLGPYVFAQILPMLLVATVLGLVWPKDPPQLAYGAALVFYVLAKLAEEADLWLLTRTGVSGHTLKHVVAAVACLAIVSSIRRATLPATRGPR